jgi:hypothetical protein
LIYFPSIIFVLLILAALAITRTALGKWFAIVIVWI